MAIFLFQLILTIDILGVISYYVGKYLTGQYGSDRTYKAGTVTSLVIPQVYDVEDDFDKLSHIKQLSSLSLRDKDIIIQGYVTSMIASIPQLEELDLSGNDLLLYSLESLKDIKNLKKLYLEKVKIALTEDYLSSDELNVVKGLAAKLRNYCIMKHYNYIDI